jgi:hypothetical protein
MGVHDREIGEEIGRQIKREFIEPLNEKIADLEKLTRKQAKEIDELENQLHIFELEPEELAQKFHDTYERLAPNYGYTTRQSSAVAWKDVPEPNKSLMIAVAAEILGKGGDN